MKIMIVDDEERTRLNLSQLVDWSEYDIQVVATAINSIDALQKLDQISIDILITDIRMPDESGLELIQKLISKGYNTKYIVLSGYDDFLYAKEAIKLGVSEYLLKPCSKENLIEAVLKVKKLIEKEQQQENIFKLLRNQLVDESPYIKDKYLNILTLPIKPSINVVEKLEYFGVSLNFVQFTVIIINVNISTDIDVNSERMELIKLAIKDLVSRDIKSISDNEVFINDDEIIIILKHNNDLPPPILRDFFKKIVIKIQSDFEIQVSVYIGNSYLGYDFISESYSDAAKIINTTNYNSNNSIFFFSECQKSSDQFTKEYPINEEKDIISAIKQMHKEQLTVSINNYFYALEVLNVSKNIASNYLMILWASLYHFAIDTGLDTMKTFNKNIIEIEKIISSGDKIKMKMIIQDITQNIFSEICIKSSFSNALNHAKKHIDTNYMHNISRENVAKSIFVSPSYLSTLFKQEMGITFIDYLNKIRIMNARLLLQNTDRKVYEIAQATGYNDDKYFSQVFKKLEGMTPAEYRNRFNKLS
jgi:two-component system, response regulator YesN